MRHVRTSWPTIGLLTGALSLALVAAVPTVATAHDDRHQAGPLPGGYTNLVVIYQENHSFDNLYGQWGRVGGRVVDGLQNARGTTTQVAQDGTAYRCLLQNDVNLTSPSPCRRRAPTPPTGCRRATSATAGSPSTGSSGPPTPPARHPASSPPTGC